MKKLGPYTVGEIPPPLEITHTDNDGNPIESAGYDGVFQIKRIGGTLIERDAPVDDNGVQTHTWEASDFVTAGLYEGIAWIGNGTTRLASESGANARHYVWRVDPGLGSTPDI